MYDFGVKLRELRLNKSMTQKRLANLIEVTETAISKYELIGKITAEFTE